MNIRIFITGGTGSFGRALLRYWIKQHSMGASAPLVTVLSRSPQAFLEQFPEFQEQPWLSFHLGNILECETLPKGEAFTYVLHAAADSTLESQLVPLNRYDQIVNGTRNVLEFAIASGVERFLFISSGGVYGKQPINFEGIPESYHGIPDLLHSSNGYSMAKRTAEHLCALYHAQYKIEIVIARCFTFVGRDFPLSVHFAIGNFIRDALWRDEIVVEGDGTAVRSYLDQSDLAEWLLALMKKGKAGNAFNVGSDKAITIAELAFLVRDLIAPNKRVRVLGGATINGERSYYVPDITQAKEELGLAVNISLEDAIRNTAEAVSKI